MHRHDVTKRQRANCDLSDAINAMRYAAEALPLSRNCAAHSTCELSMLDKQPLATLLTGSDIAQIAYTLINQQKVLKMIQTNYDEAAQVLTIQPYDKLSENDIDSISIQIDDIIKSAKPLYGILIDSQKFPGWSNFTTLFKNARLVGRYKRQVKRVALATDSKYGKFLDSVVELFTDAEVETFPYRDIEHAESWAAGEEVKA